MYTGSPNLSSSSFQFDAPCLFVYRCCWLKIHPNALRYRSHPRRLYGLGWAGGDCHLLMGYLRAEINGFPSQHCRAVRTQLQVPRFPLSANRMAVVAEARRTFSAFTRVHTYVQYCCREPQARRISRISRLGVMRLFGGGCGERCAESIDMTSVAVMEAQSAGAPGHSKYVKSKFLPLELNVRFQRVRRT